MEKATSTSVVLKITSSILRVFLNIIFYVLVTWAIVTAGKYTYQFAYQIFGSVSVEVEPGMNVEFQIEDNEGTYSIAKKLEVCNLIPNKYSFYLKTKLKEYVVYPGTYILNTSMDYNEILDEITDFKNAIEYKKDTAPD